MRNLCPYAAQPASAMWRDSVAKMPSAEVDPTLATRFRIDRNMGVASAGSCFAQHIRNQLVRRGYNYLITEPGPADLSEDEHDDRQFGVFPARFGNIYTTVQLLQLFDRAYGSFVPEEDFWLDAGRYYDPFRPHIEPEGFATLAELREDRDRHLAATRRMFETVELFVFTLGLTEAWRSRIDGAVFPVCPGCSVGTFEPDRHEFINFGVRDSAEALFAFIEKLRSVNHCAHIILTVSPVPLLATMTPRHVIEATTYSKSVLRVVAEEARQQFDHVEYFPSYEIITATHRTNEFFAGDRRTVTPAGVGRVMDLFFHRYAGEDLPAPVGAETQPAAPQPSKGDGIICDEEQALRALDNLAR
jgi:hypothetical protein